VKLIIEVDTKSLEDMVEASALLNSYSVKLNLDVVRVNSDGVEESKEEITTPSMGEESKELVEPPKPKRKRRSKVVIDAEKAEEAEEAKPDSNKLSLGDIKLLAQGAVARTDRVKVKACINVFAGKLNEVAEVDYPKLSETLKAL